MGVPAEPMGVLSRDVAGANVSSWLAAAQKGYCGRTSAGDEGDCVDGDRGVLLSGKNVERLMSVEALAEVCLRLCSECRRCGYISLFLEFRDCSWYRSCGTLQTSPMRVRRTWPLHSGAERVCQRQRAGSRRSVSIRL